MLAKEPAKSAEPSSSGLSKDEIEQMLRQANRVSEKQGELDKDPAIYTEAIEPNPQDAKTYNTLGWAHYHNGDYDKAIADFTKRIEIAQRCQGVPRPRVCL